MNKILCVWFILFAACSANVIQTGGQSVVCMRGRQVVLNSAIDHTAYELVFVRDHYELRLLDSHRPVAKYDTCQIEILSRPPAVSYPNTR